jgi:molybdopterin-guanine dinucleotide biosynthesis protein MobB
MQRRHGSAGAGPKTFCVRGPSRSGKTSIVERLVREFESEGIRVACLKRSHHQLDLPEKASGRVWASRPSAMVLSAADRLQLTLPAGDGTVASLLALVPAAIDLVLLETHTPEPYPTILSALATPEPGEEVIGRWALNSIDAGAAAAAAAIRGRLAFAPGPEWPALRTAASANGFPRPAGALEQRLEVYA